MHLKIHSKNGDRYFIRCIKFDESEVEYSDADFSKAVEIDVKNYNTHLEMTEDSFQITIEETTARGTSTVTMQTEEVLLVIWDQAKYFPGDLKKFATDIAGYNPMRTGMAYEAQHRP